MSAAIDVKREAPVTTDRLAAVLTLQKRLLAAKNRREAEYILVNDTAYLVKARQMLFVYNQQLSSHSSVPDISAQTPYLLWAKKVVQSLSGLFIEQTSPQVVSKEQVNPESFRQEWPSYWPEHGLWVPMVWRGQTLGALLILREGLWKEAEKQLLQHWVASAAPVISQSESKGPSASKKRVYGVVLAALILIGLCWPVHLTVLSDAEVVPKATQLVRAPLDGIIKTVHVEPNQRVEKGQILLTLDDSALYGQLEKSRQALAVIDAEYRRSLQQAMSNPASNAEVPLLAARVKQAQSEVDFLQGELKRVSVIAPQTGVAMISSVNDWLGKPVALGEKIMAVAGSHGEDVELWIPSADNIPLPDGAPIKLYWNVDPSTVMHAQLLHVNYRAEMSPSGVVAYRGRAKLLESNNPPIAGWRGIARIEGEKVSLFFYFFRRPLASLRSWLGV